MQNNFKGQKFFVTGCAGFIGSFVTDDLLSKGAYVYGIDNLNTGSLENIQKALKNSHFEFINGDLCNKALTQKLVKDSDFIYHAAVRGIGLSTDNPHLELDVNIKGTLILLDLMKKSKVKRLVYASSASVYGNTKRLPEKESHPTNPLSPYGVSKLAAERYAIVYHHLYGLPIVALRYFNVYGARQRSDALYGGVVSIFINNALSNKPLYIYGDGKQTRDFTYIDDAVKATIDAFGAESAIGQVINISGGKEYTVALLAQKIKAASGKVKLPILFTDKRLIDNVHRRFGDIKLAKKLLNYSPQITLDVGLLETFKWHKRKLKNK